MCIADCTGYFPLRGKHQLLREMKDGDTDVSECVTIFRVFSFSTCVSITRASSLEFKPKHSSDVAGGQRIYLTFIK